jgi:hypothetical protein
MLFTAGVSTSSTVPEEERPEVNEMSTVEKLAHALWHVLNRKEVAENERLETRRYRDPREHDENHRRNLRRLEGNIEDSEPDIYIKHDEGGGDKEPSWRNWVLAGVSLSLVGMLSWALGKLDTLNQEVATLQATQTMGFAAIAQRQTADEQRIDRIEGRVYRGAGP